MDYYEAPSFIQLVAAFLLGAIVGGLFSDKMRPYRKYLWYLLGLVLTVICFKAHVPGLPFVPIFLIGAVVAFKLLRDKLAAQQQQKLPDIYGTAHWADLDHLQKSGLIEPMELREA